MIHWQCESCESCEMQSMPALVQSPLQVPPAGGQCCCCCCSCYVFIIRLLDIQHVPRVRLIATPCCTVHNKSNTLSPPHPLSFPRVLVPYLHLTSARPVSASAWGIAPRGANANWNRQAKALKGKKDSAFDGQSQIGMDKLKIAQLICHCVDSIIVCPSHSRPETQLKRRI